MIKKVLITSALVAGFAASASADAVPQVTLGGSLDTQFGYVDQKKAFRHINPSDDKSSKLNNHSLVNDTKLFVKVDGEAEAGFKYGGMIKLNADTSKAKEEFFGDDNKASKAEQTMGYVEGMFGRVEFGNYHGASATMQVGASSLAKATGGVNGDARYWRNHKAGENNVATKDRFLETPNLYTNELGLAGNKARNAGKVTYYTPSFAGFMFGVSYAPDLASHGTISNAKNVARTVGSANVPAFKNVWEGGLQYENMFDQVGVKAAVLGQAGDAKKHNNAGKLEKKYRNLRAWEAGVNVTYMGFTVGGSYGDLGKSLVAKDSKVKGARYWTTGAAYAYGPFGASLTYMNTQRGVEAGVKKNKLESYSFGLDYKLAPGLMPYAEVTHFKAKDHTVDPVSKKAYASNKGTVFLLGSKLQF